MANEISQEYDNLVRKHLLESAEVKKKVANECLKPILEAANLIINTFETGGKVMICGNGGSAAESQHMAGEYVCLLNHSFKRPGLPAISLTTDTSILTAHANDMGFEKIFKRQIKAIGKSGDLLIAISTSGNSANILAAAVAAKSSGIPTIGLSGREGKLQKVADIAISVPSAKTQFIQESHMAIGHVLCAAVEDHLFGTKKKYGNK